LQRSMNKFMKALPADRPVERNNVALFHFYIDLKGCIMD
jgi:hypothetical protein